MKRRPNSNGGGVTAFAGEVERAAAVSSSFHGREIEWVRDVTEQYVFRPVHAILGDLRCLWVGPDESHVRPVRFTSRRPNLGVTPDQRSLYVLGGDQDFGGMAALGLADGAQKDRLVFGQLQAIEYFTAKDFHNFDPTIYFHQFGSLEDGNEELLEPWQRAQVDAGGRGPVPVLGYDALNGRFSIDGGAYFVRREGIVF